MPEILIKTKDLKKIYGDDGVETPAVNGIDLQINSGEFVAIIGPSGSGKSTLLQILGCLDRPTSGSFLFDGREISTYKDDELAEIRRTKVGFVFQAFNLLPRLSVKENVMIPMLYADIRESERIQWATKLIDLVGLTERADYQVSKLSGGQKQRVAIARALTNNPKVIFADEPTGSLDSKSGEVILDFFQKLHQRGNTIVLVTHESYVAQSAERIISIKDGKVASDEKVLSRKIISEQGFSK